MLMEHRMVVMMIIDWVMEWSDWQLLMFFYYLCLGALASAIHLFTLELMLLPRLQ